MKLTINPLTGLPQFTEEERRSLTINSGGNPGIRTIVAGTNITVNTTDPQNPIVSSTASGGSGSGITRTVTVTSGNFTAGNAATTDYIYLHAGAHNATLPTASSNSNRYTFKNKHSAAVTVTRAGADTIEGATSITIQPNASVDLISDGSAAWSVI